MADLVDIHVKNRIGLAVAHKTNLWFLPQETKKPTIHFPQDVKSETGGSQFKSIEVKANSPTLHETRESSSGTYI